MEVVCSVLKIDFPSNTHCLEHPFSIQLSSWYEAICYISGLFHQEGEWGTALIQVGLVGHHVSRDYGIHCAAQPIVYSSSIDLKIVDL